MKRFSRNIHCIAMPHVFNAKNNETYYDDVDVTTLKLNSTEHTQTHHIRGYSFPLLFQPSAMILIVKNIINTFSQACSLYALND